MSNERLDRLEALAEAALQGLQQQREISADILETLRQQREINAAMQEAQNVDRAEFRAHVETSWQTVAALAQNMQEMQSEIREIQHDIRGLQTENRRILERLEARG